MISDLILEHGEEYVGNFWPYKNIVRPYSMLYYPIKGTGYYQVKDKKMPFVNGTLYLFPPNQPISLDYEKGDELLLLFVHVYISPDPLEIIEINSLEDDFLLNIIKLLRKYVQSPNKVYTEKLTELLVSYIFEGKSANIDNPCESIRDYIKQNYISVYKNNNLSKVFNYSNSYIIKLFKDNYNTTPRQYALKLLLKYILSLFKSGKSVKEVSSMLQFSSPENFSKFFKKELGSSPSAFKKQAKKDKQFLL